MVQTINFKRLKFYIDIVGISSLLVFIGLIIKNGYVNEFEVGFQLTGISLYIGAPLFLVTIFCGISSEVLKRHIKNEVHTS
ncbi:MULTISPECIES: hypothetical protein [Allobacillus]|uniref:Uncharacterized protein n=1 Tax=Allobacillus salarius TaxID=1955272 RepID=A0A556PNW6_9BACI|nr:hypothetical protein [Allobacillus salarius]TSJ66039.1 hypothetical protein FPQ13_05600 [Allobacillus salarius]